MKGFTKWLATYHKLPRDPLVSVAKPNPKTDRRRERRMLLPEEWEQLRDFGAMGIERYGMTSHERILLYAVAIQTGLRSSELRSLTRGCLFLDLHQPFIMCKASSTKNRKDARQHIQPALANELSEYVATKSPKAPVFSMPEETTVAAMLRADLADARKEWIKLAQNDPHEHLRREQGDFLAPVSHEGEILDFHSLRHTCGAWLAMNGAYPKAVQSVMRHSTITLTMDTYGHLFPGQDAATIAYFPSMLSDRVKELRATGTTDVLAIPTI
jgi:integrase